MLLGMMTAKALKPQTSRAVPAAMMESPVDQYERGCGTSRSSADGADISDMERAYAVAVRQWSTTTITQHWR
ncbi:hypothetical protein GCM10009661_53660 [Catellatospora chokoriensis]|uniref:Uncharacterized protein n=1 Tax=Catellatospora chokoriensis TaxID=310353 RepID=A0A8J3NUU6_9ACTN|nr:hypothetical protein Cch02nite_50240 [Catellatospora chokoriensis]